MNFYLENPLGGDPIDRVTLRRNLHIENGAVTMIHTDAGYYTPVVLPPGASGPSVVHLWYLKDHLGNNRVLAYGSGNAVALHDHGFNGAFLKPHLRDWQ